MTVSVWHWLRLLGLAFVISLTISIFLIPITAP